jgi:hypothetical protein
LGAHAKDKFRNEQIACCNYAFENGIDKPEIVEWKWPYGPGTSEPKGVRELSEFIELFHQSRGAVLPIYGKADPKTIGL